MFAPSRDKFEKKNKKKEIQADEEDYFCNR